MNTFEALGLKPELLKAIEAAGYTKPMRIQAQAIPVALGGRDLIGCAQTGTGKTAAFALPILHRLTRARFPQALALAPTRELAIQIGDSFRKYGKHLPFKSVTVYGGVDYEPQIKALRKGADVIIATPGRLLDLMGRDVVSLEKTGYLVLDEADRMLDMGFLPDVERIIHAMPNRGQTMLFSATMPPEIRRLASRYMKEAAYVEVSPPATVAIGITHRVYPVPRNLKSRLLIHLLRDEPVQSALIFTRTRRGADRLARYLQNENLSVERLHSDRSQSQRQRALRDFRSGKVKMLVATDIAARGLDIPTVSHVFNYDLPECAEDYVHRAGRTARAEGTGFAFCLMAPEDIDQYNALEMQFGREKLAWTSHPGFDYLNELNEPPDDPSRSGPRRSPRGRSFQQSRRRTGAGDGRPARPRRRSRAFAVQPAPNGTGETDAAAFSATKSVFGRRKARTGRTVRV